MFFDEYCEIFKNSFFVDHIWCLPLNALTENTNDIIFDHINKFINVFPSISQQQKFTIGIFLFEIIHVS